MRFETSNSPPPFLNRRFQLRMMGFVALIGVIMFVMTSIQVAQKKRETPAVPPGSPDPSVYDVIPNRETQLKDGEFVSPPDLGTGQPIEEWTEPPPLDAPQADTPAQPPVRIAFDKSMLRRVQDNTIGVRREESPAFYELLNYAHRAPADAVERAGATDVLYANLMDEPDRYRGEPVTIHGDLWRLYEFEAGENPLGLKTLYEAWVITADSDTHPYRIVFTDLPVDLQPGVNLRVPVRVTGFFFKREGYASQGGMHVAPTLLAQRVIPFRPPGAPPRTDALVPYMIGLVSTVGLAFLVTLVSFSISDRRAARAALARSAQRPTPSFSAFNGPPPPTVLESLRRMEQESWQAEADRVDEEYDEVATALAARNPLAPPQRPSVRPPLSSEQKSQQARLVKDWAAQQSAESDDESEDDLPQEYAPPTGSGSLSKLAAWEEEIQQFAEQPRPLTAEERAAQRDLERDQLHREQQLQDQIARQRAELERERESTAESNPDVSDEPEEEPPQGLTGWFRRGRRRRDR